MDIQIFLSPWPAAAALLALVYGFSNGFRDSSTLVASVVSTRALSPHKAYGLCAIFEFIGASFIGVKIAQTFSGAVVGSSMPNSLDLAHVVVVGLVSAIAWGIICAWRAWPTSNSQSLVGGLAGASAVVWGSDQIFVAKKIAVIVILILSPTIGFLIATVLTSLMRYVGEWMTTSTKPAAQALHVFGCLTMATVHGSNDGQIMFSMIVLATAITTGNMELSHSVQLRMIPATAIAIGVMLGGFRLIKGVGQKFYRIRDMQGVGAQTASVATLLACISTGFPASTMQLVSATIVGAGVAKNAKAVRWLAVREIVLSWIITVPSTAALSAILMLLLRGGL